jgi:16S rRNA G1207 methylase RsmC
MKYDHNGRAFEIKRYPPTTNRSLQPWNASDELLIDTVTEFDPDPESLVILNDRFGFLATVLFRYKPYSVLDSKSHQIALERNYISNSLVLKERRSFHPLKKLPKLSMGIIKIPKSLEEFEFLIQQVHRSIDDDGVILCGFMTKYFTPQLLEISSKYFDEVEQTKAKKKSRLLVLKKKKEIEFEVTLNTINFKERTFKQYPGVFSSDHIDYATQFLLEHLKVKDSDLKILDLAAGNGVIASSLKERNANAEIHLVEDSRLAIESSKLNIEDVNFHWNDSLEEFDAKSFDLIVSNPPFHFEYENNIEVSLNLFSQAQRCLKENGKFIIVANKHLNYKTHLDTIFSECSILKENDKFVIYECLKSRN